MKRTAILMLAIAAMALSTNLSAQTPRDWGSIDIKASVLYTPMDNSMGGELSVGYVLPKDIFGVYLDWLSTGDYAKSPHFLTADIALMPQWCSKDKFSLIPKAGLGIAIKPMDNSVKVGFAATFGAMLKYELGYGAYAGIDMRFSSANFGKNLDPLSRFHIGAVIGISFK